MASPLRLTTLLARLAASGTDFLLVGDALAEAKTRIEAMRASRASGGGTGP